MLYVKALHIIFIVTWFSGLFYIVRLFIYNTEAGEKPEPEKSILQKQFSIMIKRLWYGITWPSAVLTLILGCTLLYMYGAFPAWLILKLCFVLGLFLYHFSLQRIFNQQMRGEFKYTSQQLRIWNEVATLFLFAIVMLVEVKDNMNFLWGMAGIVCLMIALILAIRIYKVLRK
jgi:putative membrane protein